MFQNLNNDDKYDYAAFCLRTGDFEGWHKYYDFRFEKEHNKTYYPSIEKPRWDGKKKIKTININFFITFTFNLFNKNFRILL